MTIQEVKDILLKYGVVFTEYKEGLEFQASEARRIPTEESLTITRDKDLRWSTDWYYGLWRDPYIRIATNPQKDQKERTLNNVLQGPWDQDWEIPGKPEEKPKSKSWKFWGFKNRL